MCTTRMRLPPKFKVLSSHTQIVSHMFNFFPGVYVWDFGSVSQHDLEQKVDSNLERFQA